jgi:hypothetical protein
VAVVDVLGNLLRGLLVDQVGVGGVGADGDGEQAVDNNVGVPPNRRGEVGVDRAGQTVVPRSFYFKSLFRMREILVTA